MIVNLKKTILDLAKLKKIKLHDYTIAAVRVVERKIENNKDKNLTVKNVLDELRNFGDLEEFEKGDWEKIEKEISRMLK